MILIAGKDMHHASESNGEPLLTWRLKIHWWSPRKRDAVTAGGSVGTWKAVGRRDRHLRRAALKNCEMPVAPWVAVGRPASRLSSWQTTDCPPALSLIGLSRITWDRRSKQIRAFLNFFKYHLNPSSHTYLLLNICSAAKVFGLQ